MLLPTVKVKIIVCKENAGRLWEWTNPPSQRLFHHSVHGDRTVEPRTPPKDRSLPWVSLPLLVNAEVATLCVPTSIACQRYHTPDSPHLRHGRPPRCSLVDFHRPNWSNKGQKEGREAFCPFYMGYRKTFGCANATPKILLPKSSWGFGGFFQEAPKRTPVLLR